MDMHECPVTLGRAFLPTSMARINLEYKEIVLRLKGKYLIHQISQDKNRQDAGTEFHAVDEVDPYSSHENIEQPRADNKKNNAFNTKRADIME